MSHSWYDDADIKWSTLQGIAEKFRTRHGRYPTFWLDKTCIDQNNIKDGLRTLPVFVMASRKMLALCGATYALRLWCVWELFTLLAFTAIELALERMLIVPLQLDRFGQISHFQLKDAHCYDPNEKAKLRLVIEWLGADVFAHHVCTLGEAISKNDGHMSPLGLRRLATQKS